MTGQEALTLVDTLLRSTNQKQRLNDVQSAVFRETCAGRSYKQIAEQLGYQHDYIKQVGSQLWRSLSQTLGEPISKHNLQSVLRRYQQSQQAAIAQALPHELEALKRAEIDAALAEMAQDPEYQAQVLQMEAEFAVASWKVLQLGESSA
jgi:hypothetical protein